MQGTDTPRDKHDARDYSVKCANCGKWFEATRSDASYCSSNCRVHAHRAPARKKNAILGLQQAGYAAIETSRKYAHSDDVYKEMLYLRRQIAIALNQFETEQTSLLSQNDDP